LLTSALLAAGTPILDGVVAGNSGLAGRRDDELSCIALITGQKGESCDQTVIKQ
jgi:hypothetical protein